MTTDERQEAARVMASNGPWDMRTQDGQWAPINERCATPLWDWSLYEYRIRPAPPPAPLSCCPCCGSTIAVPSVTSWQRCPVCDCRWAENMRAPFPTCAGNVKTAAEVDAFRRDRDAWKEAYYEAYRVSKGWEEEAFESSAKLDELNARVEKGKKQFAELRGDIESLRANVAQKKSDVRDLVRQRDVIQLELSKAYDERDAAIVRAADCPDCARLAKGRLLAWNERDAAIARAEAAEKRCAEAARMLREVRGVLTDSELHALCATLEGKP